METDVWRWADPAGQQRVVRFDELRAALVSGVVPPNAPVWRPGWANWQSAQEVPELTSSALSAVNGVVPNIPPPPLAVVAVQAAFEARAGDSFAPPAVGEAPIDKEPPPPPRYVPAAVNPHASISGGYPVVSVPSGPPAPAARPVSVSQQPAAPYSMSPSAMPPPIIDKDDPPLAALVSQGPRMTGPPSAPPMPSKDRTALGIGPGPSLPTEIGVPSPAELAATALAPKSVRPPPSSMKPPPPPGASVEVEEMSGSVLLDDVVPPDRPAPMNGALPPPTDPIYSPERFSEPDDMAGLPRPRGPLNSLIRDFGEVKEGRPPKNKRLAIVTVVLLASVGIVAIALLVTAARAIFGGKKTSPPPLPSVALTPSHAPSVTAPPPSAIASEVVPPPDPPKTEPSLGECSASGEAKSLGWRAVVNVGVESAITGNAVGLGFASNARDGVVLTVDPTNLAVTGTLKGRGIGGDVKRVSPTVVSSKLVATVDVDKKGDKLAGRRVVATTNPIDLGFAESSVVWASHGKDAWAKLFALEGDGAPDGLRGVPHASGKGVGFVFRRGGALYVGAAKGESTLEAQGSLAKIVSLGQVGSPSISASGDSFVVAWADRATQADPWQVRFTSFTPGTPPKETRSFALPEGGIGGQAMSPSVMGLGAGRMLISWMEGPASSHQIRAQVLGSSGNPEGSAISVSPNGMNAGNPSVILGADGKGVVAFLGAKKNAFEVWVAPLSCAAK